MFVDFFSYTCYSLSFYHTQEICMICIFYTIVIEIYVINGILVKKEVNKHMSLSKIKIICKHVLLEGEQDVFIMINYISLYF